MSGSMAHIRNQTIASVDAYIEALDPTNTTISVTTFEGDNVNHIRKAVPVAQFESIEKEYHPAGGTNLYDAIGGALSFISKEVTIDDEENVAFVVLTDGYENTSKEYDKDKIKTLLEQKSSEKWMVSYLGANQDGWAGGAALGAQGNYSATFNTSNMGSTFRRLAASTSTYNSSARNSLAKSKGFFDEANTSFGGFSAEARDSFVSAKETDAIVPIKLNKKS